MEHRITSVDALYNEATSLYRDNIQSDLNGKISQLKSTIETLSTVWGGADGVQNINNLRLVCNGLINLRSGLCNLAEASAQVAVKYRDIQIAGSGGKGAELSVLVTDKDMPKYTGEYVDTIGDGVKMTLEQANECSTKINSVSNDLEGTAKNIRARMDSIENIWIAGPGRDCAESAYSDFSSNMAKYKGLLTDVQASLQKAINLYNS